MFQEIEPRRVILLTVCGNQAQVDGNECPQAEAGKALASGKQLIEWYRSKLQTQQKIVEFSVY